LQQVYEAGGGTQRFLEVVRSDIDELFQFPVLSFQFRGFLFELRVSFPEIVTHKDKRVSETVLITQWFIPGAEVPVADFVCKSGGHRHFLRQVIYRPYHFADFIFVRWLRNGSDDSFPKIIYNGPYPVNRPDDRKRHVTG